MVMGIFPIWWGDVGVLGVPSNSFPKF